MAGRGTPPWPRNDVQWGAAADEEDGGAPLLLCGGVAGPRANIRFDRSCYSDHRIDLPSTARFGTVRRRCTARSSLARHTSTLTRRQRYRSPSNRGSHTCPHQGNPPHSHSSSRRSQGGARCRRYCHRYTRVDRGPGTVVPRSRTRTPPSRCRCCRQGSCHTTRHTRLDRTRWTARRSECSTSHCDTADCRHRCHTTHHTRPGRRSWGRTWARSRPRRSCHSDTCRRYTPSRWAPSCTCPFCASCTAGTFSSWPQRPRLRRRPGQDPARR